MCHTKNTCFDILHQRRFKIGCLNENRETQAMCSLEEKVFKDPDDGWPSVLVCRDPR